MGRTIGTVWLSLNEALVKGRLRERMRSVPKGPAKHSNHSETRSAPIDQVVANATHRGSLVDDLVGPFARFLLVQTIPGLLVLGESKPIQVFVRKLLARGVVGPFSQNGGTGGNTAARLSGFWMLGQRISAHGLHDFEDLSFGAIILHALVDVSGHRPMLRARVPGVVGVSLRTAAIKGGLVGFRQRQILSDPPSQIRVGNQ